MRKWHFLKSIIFFSIVSSSSKAQKIEGVYRMQGGHEMVAAFEFKQDSFRFYFIYGAVDRSAGGSFTIQNGNIILHAAKIPGKDFTIVRQEKRGDGTSIKISDPNTALLRNIVGFFIKGIEQDQQFSDDQGMIHSKMENCDTIFVMHSLFPDAPTLIKSKVADKNNYFELTLNPSLAELSFKDFILTIDSEELTGSLPWLFEREKAVFVKESEEPAK
jgi:hypothetical protein